MTANTEKPIHASDCSMHNGPALAVGPCDCGAEKPAPSADHERVEPAVDRNQGGAGAHTPGPWKAVAHGGHSTVVSMAEPSRNDNRIPPYAYDEKRGYSVGYPFVDEQKETRLDFVCFSHTDARLIAAAPELLDALIHIEEYWNRDQNETAMADALWHIIETASAAIAKARGG